MALTDNPFLDLPIQTLLTMQTQWLQVLSDLAAGGKSYSFPGRTYTRADWSAIKDSLVQLRAAIRYAQKIGFSSAQVVVDTQSRFSG